MKKIRLLIFYVLFFATIFIGSFGYTKADYSGFVQQLLSMNIPINTILTQTGITRYELTRLLNSVECKDCINPNINYIDRYTSQFWNNFVTSPGRDFRDIAYQKAKYNNKDYYYCVAYVGDNEYMRGYPVETSPVCAGQFCGLRYTTKAEFLQVIINMISRYLYPIYALNWSEANSWLDDQGKNSYEGKTFNEADRKIISARSKDCGKQSCILQNADELKVYLKYCMFNLEECGMVPLGKIKEGYWPVAELNMLYKQQMIDIDEAVKYDIGKLIDGKLVTQVLAKMNEIIGCSFNNDYDCDGITNMNDNCPNTYSPHQKDTDGDGIGDVCDDDIDGDGVKNPIGIVDDNGYINIALWTGGIDNCLFIVNNNQKDGDETGIGDICEKGGNLLSLTIGIKSMEGTLPKTVSFSALSKGSIESLKRDFGDGYIGSGQNVSHSYTKAGLYIVRLVAKGKNSNDAFAKTTVIIGKDINEKKGLGIMADKLGGTVGTDISFLLSVIGKQDSFVRNFGNGITSQTTKGNLKKLFRQAGNHQISVKGYNNGILETATILNIGIGTGGKGSLLKTKDLNPYKDKSVTFETETYGFNISNIASVNWNFGDGITSETKSLTNTHTYRLSGKKTIIQTINLYNGGSLTNLITIYVLAPNIFDSYGMQFLPSSLSNTTFKNINLTTDILGNSLDSFILFTNNYDDGVSDIIKSSTNIKTPITKKHIYKNPGIYYLQSNISINQCFWLSSQATLAIGGSDSCLQAKLNGTLSNYKCDLDQDGIPDVCDDDIDGDGKKNLLGIITSNQNNCKYIDNITNNKTTNLNTDILNKHFLGACSLDNAPFQINFDQVDRNKNGIGDVMDIEFSGGSNNDIINNDPDKDGDKIPDHLDLCSTLPENYNNISDYDGCPEIGNDLSCENNIFPALQGGTQGTIIPNINPNDIDGDGVPNNIDNDIDGDGISNNQDDDIDGDGILNNLDDDMDSDGTLNNQDNDVDGDGLLNNQDNDIDGDGLLNNQDNDVDGDGLLNNQDNDVDGDGLLNNQDNDINGDGTINNQDIDIDGDGIPNNQDNDMDGDGIPNNQDDDIDGDGIPNDQDDTINGQTGDVIEPITGTVILPGLLTCGNGVQDEGENCITCPQDSQDCLMIVPQVCSQCPCPYSDFSASLINDDQVKAVLRDDKKEYPRGYSLGFPINY